MRNPFKSETDTVQKDRLDSLIDQLLEDLESLPGSTEEYQKTADQLLKLMEHKKKNNASWRPSPDVVVGGAITLATTLLVLHHEKLNVISSKAFGFVGRMNK